MYVKIRNSFLVGPTFETSNIPLSDCRTLHGGDLWENPLGSESGRLVAKGRLAWMKRREKSGNGFFSLLILLFQSNGWCLVREPARRYSAVAEQGSWCA